MNVCIFASGLVCLFTALVHILAGQADPIKPFLKSNLPDVPKATLLACWHMVSAILVISGLVLSYIGWYDDKALYSTTVGFGITFIVFSGVFIAVGWYFFKSKSFIKLPQWTLLLPIGLLALIGVL